MHWLAVASCVWFAAAALWESFGPSRSGHLSTSAAYAMAGENMVHWKKFAVYSGYLLKPATPDQYYCHHPYGIMTLEAIAYLLFGHHWFTVRAGAIFCSIITAPSVYGFGRRAWGVIPASVATIFVSFAPIDLAYSDFSNLEEPTIAFGMLFAWATAMLWETSKTRYLVLSAIGALGCANGDWAGLVFLMPVVGFGFFRAYVFPRSWYGRLDERQFARWFAFATVMSVGSVIMYLYLFAKADKIGDLMGSYHLRSSGAEATVASMTDVMNAQRRKMWLGMMLTPVSFGAMAAGLPLAVIRLVKKPLEIVPIAWFMAASFQYFVFKQGADVHIFWPHYYAPTAALAAGTLTASLLWARKALLALIERFGNRPVLLRVTRVSTAILIGAGLGVPIFLLARVGVAELPVARRTSGRFDQGGVYVETEGDESEFAQWALSNVATQGSTVQILDRMEYGYSAQYGGNRPDVHVPSITPSKLEDPQRIAFSNARYIGTKDLENVVKNFGVQIVGPYFRIDRAVKGPDLKVMRLEEREPNVLEWMLISGTDLVRKIGKDEDPWKTWEMRDAWNLPAPPPEGNPTSVLEMRIAHNLAVRSGDRARADELSAKLAGMVGTPLGLKYTGGVTLEGVDVHYGAATVVTLFWKTDSTYKAKDVEYQAKCKIIAPPPLWVGATDYYEKDMAPQMALMRPAAWKPDGLYTQRFIALKRSGKDECRGSFTADFHPVSGDQNPVIFTLE